jgi:hypothetical protein
MATGIKIVADPQTAFRGAALGVSLKAMINSWLPGHVPPVAVNNFNATVENVSAGVYLVHYDFPSETIIAVGIPFPKRVAWMCMNSGDTFMVDITAVDEVTDMVETWNELGVAQSGPWSFVALDYTMTVSG